MITPFGKAPVSKSFSESSVNPKKFTDPMRNKTEKVFSNSYPKFTSNNPPRSLSSTSFKPSIIPQQKIGKMHYTSSVFSKTMSGDNAGYRQNIISIAKHLPMVNSIQHRMNDSKALVITGASSSGKTEQLQTAIGPGHKVFDMRNEFITKNFSKEDQSRIWKGAYYSDEVKQQEALWINENYEQIKSFLGNSHENILVFDEFDLAGKTLLNLHEEQSCSQIIKMAKELETEYDKKVVLIMHPSGLNNEKIRGDMDSLDLLKTPEDILSTSYIDPQVESQILYDYFELPHSEVESIRDICTGMPTPYLSFMKDAAKIAMGAEIGPIQQTNFREIIQTGYEKVANLWNIIQSIEPESVTRDIVDLTSGKKVLEDQEIQDHLPELTSTGFLGIHQGNITMPPIVSFVIEDKEKRVAFDNYCGPTSSPITNYKDIEVHLHAAPKSVKDGARFCLRYAGGAQTTQFFTDSPQVMPNRPSLVKVFLQHEKKNISKLLNLNTVDLEKDHIPQMLAWRNSATTVAELISDASLAKEPFIKILNTIQEETGATAYAGKNYSNLLKTEKSIASKIKKYAKHSNLSSDEAIKQGVSVRINDPIRATFICDSIDQLRDTIKIFDQQIKESLKGETLYSNKFDEDYPNGYVGIHCNMSLSVADENGNERKIKAEVQFHFSSIVDGSKESADAIAHDLYELGRMNEQPEITEIRENIMTTLFATGVYKIPTG